MVNKLFEQDLQVINIGLTSFADAINQTGGKSLQLDWRPPALGDKDTGTQLAKLVNQPDVEAANREAFERFMSAQPVLTGVGKAQDAIQNFGARTLLHAGPPIEVMS